MKVLNSVAFFRSHDQSFPGTDRKGIMEVRVHAEVKVVFLLRVLLLKATNIVFFNDLGRPCCELGIKL